MEKVERDGRLRMNGSAGELNSNKLYADDEMRET